MGKQGTDGLGDQRRLGNEGKIAEEGAVGQGLTGGSGAFKKFVGKVIYCNLQ